MPTIRATMLRDFAYDPNPTFLEETLARFGIKAKHPIAILRFEVITPDSFMWRLLLDNAIYYLYAEDHISGLPYVKEVFNVYLQTNDWELVQIRRPSNWEKASPVTATSAYTKPDDSKELMQYAAESGHDFVFLCKSKEDANEALFSDHAPRGFDQYDNFIMGKEPSGTTYLRDGDSRETREQ
jgi:hypothetical protein